MVQRLNKIFLILLGLILVCLGSFAQDDSAKFTSMPHSAIAEGIVDYILSPAAIGIELSQMSKNPLEIKARPLS